MPQKDHLDELLQKLNDPDDGERRRCVEELAELKRERSVPAMVKRLAVEENTGVQEAISEALMRIGGTYAVNGVLPLLDAESAKIRNIASEILVQIGGDYLDLLTGMLKDPRKDVRKFIVDILGDINSSEAVMPIIAALDDSDINVATSAAEALGKLGDARAVNPLIESFGKRGADMGFYCITSLAKIKDPSAVDFLLMLATGDNDLFLSVTAIEALGDIGDARAAGPLYPLLSSPNPELQRAVMKALGRIDLDGLRARFKDSFDPALAECIVAASDSTEDSDLNRFAMAALESISAAMEASIIVRLLREGKRVARSIIDNLMAKGTVSVDFLLPLAGHENDRIREMVAGVLGSVPDQKLIPPIEKLMKDASPWVRRTAMRSLSRISGAAAVPAITALLQDDDAEVRRAAVTLLGSLRAAESLGALVPFITDEDPDMFTAVTGALAAIGGPAAEKALMPGLSGREPRERERFVQALGMLPCSDAVGAMLRSALQDPNWEVRRAAVNATAAFPCPSLPDTLRPLLKDEVAAVRAAAVKTFSRMKEPGIADTLGGMLRDPDQWVRYEAIRGLGNFSGEGVVEMLIDQLVQGQPMEQVAACESLARQGDRRAAEPLKALLRSDNLEVQIAAQDALEKLQS